MNESIGGLVGIVAWMLWGSRISRWLRGMWGERVRHALAVKILITYTIILCIYQWLPFDLTIRPAELWRKWEAGNKITLVPFMDKAFTDKAFLDKGGMDAYMVAIKFAIMIPVGLLMAHVVRPGRRSFWKAAALGMLVAVGIEVGQLFVYSRYASMTDILLGTLGAAAGVWLADRVGPLARRPLVETPLWRRHGRRALWAAALAATAAYFYLKWRPFKFGWPEEGPLGRILNAMHVPLYYQYFNTEFSAISQVLRDAAAPFILAMLFMPITSAWGRWGRPAAAILAATIGVAGEMGRAFLPTLAIDPMVTPVVAAASGVAGAILYDRFVEMFVKTPGTGEESDVGLLST
jgi:glycopeptide antibiotics resistance protein